MDRARTGTHVTLLVEATVPLDFAAIDARLVEHLWRAGPGDIRGWKGQIRPLRDFGPVAVLLPDGLFASWLMIWPKGP